MGRYSLNNPRSLKMSDGESSEATKPPETPLETSIEALLKRLATGGITPELANKHLKLKIAETARLMADNRKFLTTIASVGRLTGLTKSVKLRP